MSAQRAPLMCEIPVVAPRKSFEFLAKTDGQKMKITKRRPDRITIATHDTAGRPANLIGLSQAVV